MTKPSSAAPPALRDLVADHTLGGLAFAAAYSDAADAWMRELLGDTPGVALMAVGAYGRRELCPASDLDLVLIHDGKRSRDVGAIADRIWYPIWDSGIALDHSVRTIREARAVADRDLKAALGLLDARLVAGDPDLAADLTRRIREEWRDRARRRLEALDALVVERHRASDDVAYALEPNLKEGKGGNRDLVALRTLADVTDVYVPDDRLPPAAEVLFEARVALQRQAGRTERLLLEHQDDVAATLGLADADALMARVSGAARTVAWQSDDAWRSVRSWLQGPRGRSASGRDVPLSPGLVLRDGEVALLADVSPAEDPALILRAAADAAYLGVPIARPTLRRFDAEPAIVTDPWTDETREAFVALSGGGDAAVPQFELLDQHGLLVRFLPEWDTVRFRPQRNAFHHFTVDRHLLEAIARASDRVRRVRRPDLLLVGALLHDLGKGMPGDHTTNGITLAARVATRMGFPDADVVTLLELVRLHLLLPSFATGRDLDDPATIDAVATEVGTEDTLDLLHALTEADSIATGPTAWTPWKAELVHRLVELTRAELRRRAGAPAPVPEPPRRDPRLDTFDGTLVVDPRPGGVTIVAPDAIGLLALEVAVLGVHAQDVRRARTYTVDDVAIGEFEVEPERGKEPDWDTFARDLRSALVDPMPAREQLRARERRYGPFARPTAARPAEPRVFVNNEATDSATIVEVRAADGIGVLARITDVFAPLGVRVEQAYVSTLGHEVVDTFYVTGPDREKLVAPEIVTAIERGVLRALGADSLSYSVQSDDQL
ncbi:MAG: [protein-PII] uridylyltransferase [Actinomycetota bacterium]|nr:[protein-PII] uridylyltransferase [Actinomycetota bacterium]